jgi:hypothetical protein
LPGNRADHAKTEAARQLFRKRQEHGLAPIGGMPAFLSAADG